MRVPHDDWNDWEEDWLLDEAHRPPDYIYSDKERAVLDRLVVYSKTVTHYVCHSIQELLEIAYPWRFDLDLDTQEFLEQLHAWGATDLKMRQARRLAAICRQFEQLNEFEMAVS